MQTVTRLTPPVPYRPAILLREFTRELGKLLRKTASIDAATFRTHLHQACKHLRGGFLCAETRLLREIAAEIGVPPTRVRDWSCGKDLPEPEERHLALLVVHAHLSTRYC